MPEFAEVNTQVRWLRARVTGWRVASHGHSGAGHFSDLKGDPAKAAKLGAYFDAAAIESVTQRGKHVLLRMSTGTLVSHLMFAGRWSIQGDDFVSPYKHHAEPPTTKSASFWLVNNLGARLNFHDPEYRGRVRFFPALTPGKVPDLRELGPDLLQTPESDPDFPTPWTAAALGAALRRKTAVKAVLLEQSVVAGIGNMYACEALYRAGIAPQRPANSLGTDEVLALFQAAQEVVRAAIDGGLDYPHLLQVYKRAADPSGREVQVVEIAGRDTYWVPAAQR
jgi:formamidopyrimidine-DNA glycosylase